MVLKKTNPYTANDEVGDLQADLVLLQYLTIKDFDRSYGTTTENAVKQFQTDQGLTVDGIVGDDTWTAVRSAVAALAPVPAEPDLTQQQLQDIFPRLSSAKAAAYIQPYNDASNEFEIFTSLRRAAFLGTIAAETGQLTVLTEIGDPTYFLKYEPGTALGRALGNTQTGDGANFKGRGPLQLTGRANYTAAGNALGLDLLSNPDIVATDVNIGFRVAGWFWTKKRINVPADFGAFDVVTYLVNGSKAPSAVDPRRPVYEKALSVLGVTPPTIPFKLNGSVDPKY